MTLKKHVFKNQWICYTIKFWLLKILTKLYVHKKRKRCYIFDRISTTYYRCKTRIIEILKFQLGRIFQSGGLTSKFRSLTNFEFIVYMVRVGASVHSSFILFFQLHLLMRLTFLQCMRYLQKVLGKYRFWKSMCRCRKKKKTKHIFYFQCFYTFWSTHVFLATLSKISWL